MKKNDFVQIKGLDVTQLSEKAKTLKKELADLVLDKNMKKLKDVKAISKKRKDLAQVLTVVRQKELLGMLEARVNNLPSAVEGQESNEKTEKVEKIKKEKSK